MAMLGGTSRYHQDGELRVCELCSGCCNQLGDRSVGEQLARQYGGDGRGQQNGDPNDGRKTTTSTPSTTTSTSITTSTSLANTSTSPTSTSITTSTLPTTTSTPPTTTSTPPTTTSTPPTTSSTSSSTSLTTPSTSASQNSPAASRNTTDVPSTPSIHPPVGGVASGIVSGSTFSMTTQLVTQTSVIARDGKGDIPIIAGSVVGAVAFLSVLICAALAYFRRYLDRARQRSSQSDNISPFITSSPAQSYESVNRDKAERERERIRTYPSVGVDHDHQREATRDSDEEEAGGQRTGRVSVIASGDVRMSITNHPPSYRP